MADAMTEDRGPTPDPTFAATFRDAMTPEAREVYDRMTEDRVPTPEPHLCPDCGEPIIGAAHWHEDRAMTEDRVPPWTAHGYISRAYERTADVDSMIARLHEYGYEIQPVGRLTRLRGTLSLIADGRGPARQMAAEALRRDGDD